MGMAHTADGYSAVLAAAHSFNQETLSPPLPDAEVEKTARSAWRYQSEGRIWRGSRGHARWSVELVLRCAPHKHGGDAIILATVLLAKHAMRKETFAVAARAMAENRSHSRMERTPHPQCVAGGRRARTRQAGAQGRPLAGRSVALPADLRVSSHTNITIHPYPSCSPVDCSL